MEIGFVNRPNDFYLKQLGRYASLNHNIYIAADPTPVDVDTVTYM